MGRRGRPCQAPDGGERVASRIHMLAEMEKLYEGYSKAV
jgi:hypothetical protein